MESDELDLVALRRPAYVTLPATGERRRVQFFRHEQKQLYRQWMADPNNAALLIELLRFAVPGITDEELDDLSIDEDVPRIVAKANGKAAMLELALKNGVSDGESPAPSLTLDSDPTTKTATSSAGSRKRTGAGRRTSLTSSGTRSSSPSTG